MSVYNMVINVNSTHCTGIKCDYIKNNKAMLKYGTTGEKLEIAYK